MMELLTKSYKKYTNQYYKYISSTHGAFLVLNMWAYKTVAKPK